MNEQQQMVTTPPTLRCYRHPERETLISCGRCGRPVCPDCLHHGPVGIRCMECLHPATHTAAQAQPERVPVALGFAATGSVVFIMLLAYSAFLAGAPNWLLSGIAGGTVGAIIWYGCGRAANRCTMFWAVGMGMAMPVLAMLVAVLRHAPSLPLWLLLLRVAASMVISGFMAWALAGKRR